MKGRNNYLCRRRFDLFSRQPLLKAMDDISHFQALKKWAGRTKTGDRAELKELPEDLGLWNEVYASTDTCLGQGCKFFDRCFITRLRQEAASSDVVIVNHHLFFADLAVRLRGYGEVLPRYEAVIFDEAHQLEEVATHYFGTTVSNFRFEELARDIRRELTAAKSRDETLNKISGRLFDLAGQFFDLFRKGESGYRLGGDWLEGRVVESAASLVQELTLLSAHIEGMQEPSEAFRTLSRRGEELKRQFQEVMALSDHRVVYWCEVRGKGVFLHASPVDVSSDLQGQLYTRMKTAVFTSATLSAQGNFRFFKERMGLGGEWGAGMEEMLLDSSFDMESQALLYLPGNLPDPNQPGFVGRAAEEIERILRRTEGRAFVLFTSLKNMEEAYRLLRGRSSLHLLPAGRTSEDRADSGFQRRHSLRAFCHRQLLGRGRRAGGGFELRDHRPASLLSPQ